MTAAYRSSRSRWLYERPSIAWAPILRRLWLAGWHSGYWVGYLRAYEEINRTERAA